MDIGERSSGRKEGKFGRVHRWEMSRRVPVGFRMSTVYRMRGFCRVLNMWVGKKKFR